MFFGDLYFHQKLNFKCVVIKFNLILINLNTQHMKTVEFSFNDLMDAASSKPEKDKKMEIPKFQRRRTWKQIIEDELIDTLKTGNISIGVLQLWKIAGNNKKERYLLVDGLHRVSTMRKYYDNPFSFSRTQNLISEIIKSVMDKYKTSYPEDTLKKCCSQWFNKDKLGNYEEFVIDKLFNDKQDELKEIVGSHVDKKDKDAMVKFILEKTRGLVKNMDITESKIPAIINSGDFTDLTTLFKRINQNGSKLSLCDVLAAVWANTKIEIKNKEIVEAIAEHYKEMKSENNGMDIYVENDDGKLFTVYEYMIGLRKWLLKKFGGTFLGQIKDKEFLFKVISCCMYQDIRKESIEKLNTTLLNEDLSEIEKKMVWSIEFISEVFDKILLFDGKLLITEVPFFISLISLAYLEKQKISKDKEKYASLFVMNLLNDKMSEMSFNSKTIKIIVEGKKYMFKVHKGEFSVKMDRYISDSIKLFGKNDKSTPLTKLILNVIRNVINENDEDEEDNLDGKAIFGNVIPNKTISSYNKEKNSRLPVNCLGNMCIYHQSESKRKPMQSVVTYLVNEKVSNKYIDENVTFLDGEDKFDDMLAKSDEFDKKLYIEMLKERGQTMKKMLIGHFKNYLKSDDDEEDDDNLDTETNEDEDEDDDNKSESSDSESESDEESENEEDKPKKVNNSKKEDSDSESEEESENEKEVKPKKANNKKTESDTDSSKKPKKIEKIKTKNGTTIKIKSN